MKTLIDLRETQTNELVEAVERTFQEALEVIPLGNQPIAPCIGCWSCWLKTPGLCVHKDQMSASYSHYVNSDSVILLLDTAQGFINHQAKAFFDRTIPHYHPYIELVTGECHHVARYEGYPDLVFHFDTVELTDGEETVIEDYLARAAFHFNPTHIKQLARPVRFGKVIQILIKMMGYKLINAGWDQQLKANNAYEKSADQPYKLSL